jgi:hypothetical protein
MWIFSEVGNNGGVLNAASQILLQPGEIVNYPIPQQGLAATRFWPGMGCNDKGGDCQIGQSGGPTTAGFTCPEGIGCAPPVDSKFEATFGCTLSDTSQCLNNPSGSGKLGPNDYWDTSMVDGYTLPYTVKVQGNCPGGPSNNFIDCSGLQLEYCPVNVELQALSADLTLYHPLTNKPVGCLSPCSKLTNSQWQKSGWVTYPPFAPQAQDYCCPTPPVSVGQCRSGPGATNPYVDLIHSNCPQTYAYAYDDNVGNWNCPATVTYEVVFYCPFGGSVKETEDEGQTGDGDAPGDQSGDGTSVGVIVGATIGSVVGFVLLLGLVSTAFGFVVYKYFVKGKLQQTVEIV